MKRLLVVDVPEGEHISTIWFRDDERENPSGGTARFTVIDLTELREKVAREEYQFVPFSCESCNSCDFGDPCKEAYWRAAAIMRLLGGE